MNKITKIIAVVFTVCLLAGCAANAQPTASPASASFDELIPLATAFVDQLAKGDFAAATTRFDTAMKNAMPEAKLKEVLGAAPNPGWRLPEAGRHAHR